MSYDENNIYNPKTFEELQNNYFNAYNLGLLARGLPTISFDIWKQSNIRNAFQTGLEVGLNNELLTGSLQNKTISAIVDKRDVLGVQQYGSTYLGLVNSFLNIGCTKVSLITPNYTPAPSEKGEIKVALEYPTTVTDQQIWSNFADNIGAGISTYENPTNNISFTDSIRYGSVVFNWTEFAQTPLFVNIYYKYSSNATTNLLSEDEIKANYIARYNDYYNAGANIEPAYINDVSYYPSLAYLQTEFSIDGGTTFLDRDAILVSGYNTEYKLDAANITLTNEG